MCGWINKISYFLLFGMVAGCGSVSSNQSAWDQYDYRNTVTATDNDSGYTPPQNYGDSGDMYQDIEAKKQYYQDNDEYYTPPSSFGCSPDNPIMCQ